MLKNLIALALVVFLLGWLSHTFYTDLLPASAEPLPAYPEWDQESGEQTIIAQPAAFGNREKASPADRLKLSNVRVWSDQVIINAPLGREFETAIFTNTNSMDPLIDEGTQAIQLVPTSPREIMVGDIISYDAGKYGIIIHRVIQIGQDENGWYAIVKGDNNPAPDPIKVRFNMIRRVLVGVLY